MPRLSLKSIAEFLIVGMAVAIVLLVLESFITIDMRVLMDVADWSITLIFPGGRMMGAWGAAPNPQLLWTMRVESIFVNGVSYACIGCILSATSEAVQRRKNSK